MQPTRRMIMASGPAAFLAPSAFAQNRAARSPGVASAGVFTAGTVTGQVVQGLLDSGATEHAMDAGLARTLGIRATGRRVNTLGIGGVSRGFYSDLVDLLIGGRMFARSTVAILDLSDLSNRLGQPVQMLLGRPLFNAMTVEMDFRLRTARLWERLRFTEPTDATAVKLSGIMGLMTAPVTLPGGVVYAAVDTGTMPGLVVSPRGAERLGLLKDESKVSTTLLGGVAGVSEGRITSAASLKLADKTFEDVPVRISPRPVGPEAVLGLELLSRFHLHLDLGYQRMWMRADGPQLPFQHDLLGLFGDPTPQGLKVTHVARGSPAEKAGLMAGDLIVRINGRPSVGVDVSIVNAEPGFPMTFILADGARRMASLARYY